MENSFDASYLIFMPIILICGAFIYLFGFKKPVEPPILETVSSNEEKIKKKSKPAAKTKSVVAKVETTPVAVQKQVSVEPAKQVEAKPTVEVPKVKKSVEKPPQPAKKEESKKKSDRKGSSGNTNVKASESDKTENEVNEENTSVGWVTVQKDKKQKKVAKTQEIVATEKPKIVESIKKLEKPKEPVVVEKKQEIPEPVVVKPVVEEIKPVVVAAVTPTPAVEVKRVEPEAKAQRTKSQKQVDNVDSSLKKSTIASSSQLENSNLIDTESLIRDAVETKVEDEWIPSKSSKKSAKSKQQQSESISTIVKNNVEKSKKSATSAVTNDNKNNNVILKQTALDESIILVDNISSSSSAIKTDNSNQSSSDSVQEVDDWAHVKPKQRKVRREQ